MVLIFLSAHMSPFCGCPQQFLFYSGEHSDHSELSSFYVTLLLFYFESFNRYLKVVFMRHPVVWLSTGLRCVVLESGEQ